VQRTPEAGARLGVIAFTQSQTPRNAVDTICVQDHAFRICGLVAVDRCNAAPDVAKLLAVLD
jgi:hypothetical protein